MLRFPSFPSRPAGPVLPARRALLVVLALLACLPLSAQAAARAPLDAQLLAPRLAAAAPDWLAHGAVPARHAVQALRDASAHGLDPDRYGAATLARRLDAPASPADAAAFERDLGVAMLQFLADVHFGRVASGYRPADGAPDPFDPVALLVQALRQGRLDKAADAAAPALPLYRRVQATLADYRELARAAPSWPQLPAVSGPGLHAGSPYAGAAMLRERLKLLGDLDPDADVASGNDVVFTTELAQALARFQARHGLPDDGVLGPASLRALAVPPGRRVAQLELTLERLRWLPPLAPGRVVAVNVPTYRLWAFDTRADASTPLLEMPVIVGAAARTPTPLFIGSMRYLEINPYWNVPRSIEVGEILPKLARNPAYLRQNDMELVSGSGQVLAADADALAALRAGRARVRQRPGRANALGALKFAMPNPMDIYLHSTSAQELFDRSRRDLSHGCIRVERPVELAGFVLDDPQRWSADALRAAIAAGRTQTVKLRTPVPVILFYATALSDRDGRALFADDVYGDDARLLRQLHAD